MNEHLITAELDRMWELLPQCVQAAKELETDERDPFVKIAMVGFSYQQHLEKWTPGHQEAVREYLAECAGLGYDSRMKQYLALCHGVIMGLRSGGYIGKDLVVYAMSRLPAIACAKGGQGV